MTSYIGAHRWTIISYALRLVVYHGNPGHTTANNSTLAARRLSRYTRSTLPDVKGALPIRSDEGHTLTQVGSSLGSTPGPPLDTSARQDPSDNDITESHRPHGKAMSAACHMADIVRAGVTSGFPADSRGSKVSLFAQGTPMTSSFADMSKYLGISVEGLPANHRNIWKTP